jgi:hypothetical protein
MTWHGWRDAYEGAEHCCRSGTWRGYPVNEGVAPGGGVPVVLQTQQPPSEAGPSGSVPFIRAANESR